MAGQWQGDESGNGDRNDGLPCIWDIVAALICCLAAELWQRLVERLPYLLLRRAEQWQRFVEDRQRSRKPGTLLSVPTSQAAQPCSRTREDAPLPLNENTDGDGIWGNIDISLARETNPDDLVIPVNIEPERRLNVPLVDQLPGAQAPLQDMDVNPVDPAELAILLVEGEGVGLFQQIQRDEANVVTPDQVLQPIAEEATVPLTSVPDLAVGVATPQHRSTVLPAPEVDADDDAPIFEMTAIDAPGLGAAHDITQDSAFSILPQEIERHDASTVVLPDQVREIGEVHNVHDEHFLVNSVSQDLLIPPAVQQALIPAAVKAVDSASWEVELAADQGQDEANTAKCPQVPGTSTSEEVLVPPDLVGGVAVGGSQHLPTVLQAPESVAADASEHDIFAASDSPLESFRADSREPEILADEASEQAIIPVYAPDPEIVGAAALELDISAAGNNAIAALDHPQQIETDEANSNLLGPTEVDDEVGEPSVLPIIQMASSDGDPGHFRVATASLSVPAGDLNSQLEVQMPSAITKGGATEAEATLPEEI